jgi:hypothetical protein
MHCFRVGIALVVLGLLTGRTEAAATSWEGVDWQNLLATSPSFVNGSNQLVVPINETNLGIAWSEKLTPLFPASGVGSFRSGASPFFETTFIDNLIANPMVLTEHSSAIPGDGFAITCGASGPFYAVAWQNYKTGQQASFPFALRSAGPKTVRIVRVDLGLVFRIDVYFNGVQVLSSLQVTDTVINPYIGDVYLAGIGTAGQQVVYSSFAAGLVDPTPDAFVPVDLGGGYLEPSAGAAFATTADWSPFGIGQRVLEHSILTTLPNVLEATYTPFSDALKPPSTFLANLLGSNFSFDIQLGGTWSEGAEGESEFAVYVFESPSGAGNASVRVSKVAGAVEFSLWDSSPSKLTWMADSTFATKFQVEVSIDVAGNMEATITRMNGSSIGTSFTLGPITSGLTISNPHGFRAGFEGTPLRGRATVQLSNFVVNTPENALYAFSDNPYRQVGDNILYRIGMANLAQNVFGFQAFLTNVAPAVQTFSVGGYTALPFTNWIINPITAMLSIASGVDLFGPGVSSNATLTGLLLYAASQGASWIQIDPANGQGIPTRFSDTLGQPVVPNRLHSNVVVVDSTPPVLSSLSASQGGPNLMPSGTAVQGYLDFSVTVVDPSTGSGLAKYPVIHIDFTPVGTNNGEDIQMSMYAGNGNEFRAQIVLDSNTPCGPVAVLVSAEDDSGNVGQVIGGFEVNTAQAIVNVTLANVQLPVSTTVSRWVQITLGGSGGSNPPIVVDVVVDFTDPDGVGIGNPLPANGTATVTMLPCGIGGSLSVISVKDPLHTLRRTNALTYLGNNQYSGSASLLGGDANDDNVIDVLDFGVFASQVGVNVGANTFIGQAGPHSDFSANGIVDTPDYTFISTQFLFVGDPPPGNWLLAPPNPKKAASVREMISAGAWRAREFDLNRDGWVEYQEIVNWLAKR